MSDERKNGELTKAEELQVYKDLLRDGLVKFTKKAFQKLPRLVKPCILDIGCGSGIPTMEIARLTDGQIIGLDINQHLLDMLEKKIEEAGLSHRVKTMHCPMFDMDFPDATFDIIWSEGSISVVGFERGLTSWKRFLKSSGFLITHDDLGDFTNQLEQISSCGYDLLDHFILSESIWWDEYYALLEKKLDEIQTKHADDPETLAILGQDRQFINTFKQDPKRYRSVFFIMRKR